MYKNSFEEDMLVSYSERYTVSQLIKHMLLGVINNDCIAKADAHFALCIKMYLIFGNHPELIHKIFHNDDEVGIDLDFYLFRAHTRQLTDFLDEELDWDMKSVNKELVKNAEEMFIKIVLDYNFKK